MRNTIVTIIAILLILWGVGAYGYYSQTKIWNLESENTTLSQELVSVQTALDTSTKAKETLALTVENQKTKDESEMQHLKDFMSVLLEEVSDEKQVEEITPAETSSGAITGTGTLSGTGAITASGSALTEPTPPVKNLIDTLYNPSILVEGPVSATNLIKYKLALKNAPESQYTFVGYPVQIVQGDWTMVAALWEIPVNNPITLTQSGATVPATKPVAQKPEQKLVFTIAKWRAGKIIEQYTFESQEGIDSKLSEYVK